jgi:hypothetical protein
LKIGVVTDEFSTLSGTAASVYGNSDYFREVQNQIFANSSTAFLDGQRPSSTFRDLVSNDNQIKRAFAAALEKEYEKDSEFTDYIDINYGPKWKDSIPNKVLLSFYSSMDTKSTYKTGLLGHISSALLENLPNLSQNSISNAALTISDSLTSDKIIGSNIDSYVKLADNNPQTKISVPPPNDILQLDNSIDLGVDYRGIGFPTGYLSPIQYYNNIPYPNYQNAFNTPDFFSKSIQEGYVGYPLNSNLESVFTPASTQNIQDFTPSPSQYLGNSIANELPTQESQDSVIYQISLIGNNLNKLVGFDPTIESNGDLIDQQLIPQDNNADRDGGRPTLARTYAPTF